MFASGPALLARGFLEMALGNPQAALKDLQQLQGAQPYFSRQTYLVRGLVFIPTPS